MEHEKRKIYFYPSFAPSTLLVKGLLLTEWVFIISCTAIPMIFFGIPGLLLGVIVSAVIWLLSIRPDGQRMNTYNQIIQSVLYFVSQKTFIKKPRVEEEEPLMNERKNKKNKKISSKDKKKKQKNMQDFFPFKTISDSVIEMENGHFYIFLKVHANHLNFLSFKEIDGVMTEFSKQLDRSPYLPGFFIQDDLFDIKGNLNYIQTKAEKLSNSFLKNLASDECELIRESHKDANKKSDYIFLEVDQKMLKTKSITEIKNKLKTIFKNNLNVREVPKQEMKQMLAIFANRIFSSDIPDSEFEEEENIEEKKLIRKKKKTYENQQIPGVYDFKDFITPITCNFRPSDATIGDNYVQFFTISSFIGSTEDTNLLSKVCSLKGVTTTVRMESLSLAKYRVSIKTKMKSNNAAVDDEIDSIDTDIEKDITKADYRRTKKTKQKMYFISIVFQLTAKTKTDLDVLYDQFKEKCSDVGIHIDPLQTMQRLAYETVNPIGRNSLAKWIKQNIPSESFANLYPFDDSTLLDAEGLPIGTIGDKEDIALFNLFTYRGANINVLILGVSGIGKTILMMLLLQNEAIQGSYIRNIDVEGTYLHFFERLGGINLNMAGNNEYCINPLHIRIPDEVKSGIVDDYISEVKNFMSIYKSSWSERLLDLFEHYTSAIYALKGITNTTDLTKLKATDMPLFSDIYKLIEHDRDNYSDKLLATPTDLNDLLLGMQSIANGADAKLFNRYTYLGETEEDNRIINFDLSDMKNSSLSRRLAQWSNIFTYISQFVNGNMDRRKKIVVSVDELQHFFKNQYVAILDIIEDYERRFRKYFASFIKASQTIEEFNSENSLLKDSIKALFSQSTIKFLFHLGDIDYSVTKDLLGLKEIEIETMKESRNGQCLMRVKDTIYDLHVMMPEWFSEVKSDVDSAK